MKRLISPVSMFAGVVLILLSLAPVRVKAQTGLLIVAHGADSGWNARVEATAAQVTWKAGPMRVAYLMGSSSETQSWHAMVTELVAAGAKTIVAVPLMVSTNGEHVTQIQYYAGAIKTMPPSLMAMGHDHAMIPYHPVPMKVTSALDASPELGGILVTRWQALSEADHRRALMLVAHGPSADALAPRWIRDLQATTRSLSSVMGAPVHIGLLRDDAPASVRATAIRSIRDSINALASITHDSVAVMTVLISSGSINTVTIPADLAGLPIRYFGVSLAPHAELARWIERIAMTGGN